MADRKPRIKIAKTAKPQGRITHICLEAGQKIQAQEAVMHIQLGLVEYYTLVDGKEATVYVAGKGDESHLTTRSDDTTRNNLLELPDC